jgi:peroxiredoxin
MPNIGDPAPQFASSDVINNQTYNLSDYAGQVVLLVFSGPSWCPPCKFEAPILQDLWEVFELSISQPKVQFLMVSCFSGIETPKQFKAAVLNFGLTFPALLNPNDTISTLYEVHSVPTVFVIDTEQKICDIHEGALPPAGALYEKMYNMLIGCGAGEPKHISQQAGIAYLLFGLVDDSPGMVWTPGGKPIPIPSPWETLFRFSKEKKDILLQLVISELAKGVRDFKAGSAIETAALKGAEASMRKLIARNALQPKDLGKAFSNKPKK